ncbi:Uncharacterised protein [Klebsiella pneumoniae]|nr:Uncharacterised protein [Klebsiella pneumoniae]
MLVQALLDLVDHIKVLHFVDVSTLVIGGKGLTHVLWVVHKVDDKDLVLTGGRPVEAGEGLHNLHMVGDFLVYIHGDQFGLVKACLELVGHQHHPVFRAVKGKAQILPLDIRVHALLGELLALIDDKHIVLKLTVILVHHLLASHLAGEGYQ